MKKLLSLILVSAILAVTSCDNQKAAESSTTTTTEGTKSVSTSTSVDTVKRTTVNIGPGGTSVSTKSGPNVTIDKKGIKVGGKDVNVDIKTGN